MNRNQPPTLDLSIIVPVYQVEQYIRPCIESIFRQGLDDDRFEVIIVNDGTKDRSMEVVADIIEKHKNITVINQKNQGLSAARNVGLQKAIGKYLLFIDSDDLLFHGGLLPVIEKAIESKADLIMADFTKMEDHEIEKIQMSPRIADNYEVKEKDGKTLFLEDQNPRECYIWRTLYRRQFLIDNQISFIPGICYEDLPFSYKCYLNAGKCLRINILLYIYRKGHASITTGMDKQKGKDMATAITKTWEMASDERIAPEIIAKIKNGVFANFSALMYGLTHEMNISSERIEVIEYLKRICPELEFTNGFKQRFINLLYRRWPTLYINLRHWYALHLEATFRRWKKTLYK